MLKFEGFIFSLSPHTKVRSLPSREVAYPTGKGKSSTHKCLGMGYVIVPQEGKSPLKRPSSDYQPKEAPSNTLHGFAGVVFHVGLT